MELYHIHLIGNHDHFYKENKVINVDSNKFNNRLYNGVNGLTSYVDNSVNSRLSYLYDQALLNLNFNKSNGKMNLGTMIDIGLKVGMSNSEMIKLLKEAADIIRSYEVYLREMAMEEYRKNNTPLIPSRLHSLFACSKEGIEFWSNQIIDNSVDIYRIDAVNEPFVSNNNLLPDESLIYGEIIKDSYKYFHPKNKDLNGISDEYLLQGPVKILEKVDEIRR